MWKLLILIIHTNKEAFLLERYLLSQPNMKFKLEVIQVKFSKIFEFSRDTVEKLWTINLKTVFSQVLNGFFGIFIQRGYFTQSSFSFRDCHIYARVWSSTLQYFPDIFYNFLFTFSVIYTLVYNELLFQQCSPGSAYNLLPLSERVRDPSQTPSPRKH